jgi:4'-phosphopantetheinyl transferase
MTAAATIWRTPQGQPALAPGEAHVWRAALAADEAALDAHRRLLADDERARAQRFVFERDRRRYTVVRATLRRLLGRYLDRDPQTIDFVYGAQGKPALAPASGDPVIAFNLSHAEELAAYAFSLHGQIGVDIEYHRPLKDMRQLAATVFSSTELAALDALPHDRQPAAFYACWTRKEAFIKAIGQGLSFPLKEFDVTLTPGEPARLLRIRDDAEAAQRWALVAFTPGDEFSGALMTERAVSRVSFWQAEG